MNPIFPVRSRIKDLPKTVHGGQAWKLNGIEDYSQNLNPLGPPDFISESILAAASEVGHYPDDSCAELRQVISEQFGTETDNVIVGSGSSDIIRMFPNTFLGEGAKALLHRPSFAEYTHQCRVSGTETSFNTLTEENDFRIDTDLLIEKLDGGVDAVYICNPNNPTGRIEPREKILFIAEECRKRGTLLFLDETLLELVPDYRNITCAEYVKDYPNMVIACSLTKSFAIPGIRIGFGFGHTDLIDKMNKVRMTWNVGQIEQNVATVLIRDHMDYVRKGAEILSQEAKWMHGQLRTAGFPVKDVTDSFFYFNSVEPLGLDGAELTRRMLKGGIMIRDCASFGDPFQKYVRFCVKDRQRDERFIAAMKESLRTEGW